MVRVEMCEVSSRMSASITRTSGKPIASVNGRRNAAMIGGMMALSAAMSGRGDERVAEAPDAQSREDLGGDQHRNGRDQPRDQEVQRSKPRRLRLPRQRRGRTRARRVASGALHLLGTVPGHLDADARSPIDPPGASPLSDDDLSRERHSHEHVSDEASQRPAVPASPLLGGDRRARLARSLHRAHRARRRTAADRSCAERPDRADRTDRGAGARRGRRRGRLRAPVPPACRPRGPCHAAYGAAVGSDHRTGAQPGGGCRHAA